MGKIDTAYRRLFGHPIMVRDLMACALPSALFDALDWGGMRAVPTHYVSDRLKKRSGDIAWLIPYRREPGQPPQPRYLCVLLLLEHQSTSDATMSLRAAVYTGLAYQLLLRMDSHHDIEQWRALLHTIIQATQGPEFKELKRSITAWLLLMAQSNAGLSEALPVVNSLEELDMMISEKPGIWAQQWKQEGKREGILEGELKGQANLLLRLIERRFGAVPDAVTQRIHDADESALTLWSLNILDATTLDEVFRD